MRRVMWVLIALAFTALPARAETVTIDSSNCGGECFGLSWTLTINGGDFLGGAYAYEAILTVEDDPDSTSYSVSAVSFKASSSVTGAVLYDFPLSSSNWTTSLNNVTSKGCTGSGSGFVCSQTATNPAETSQTPLVWGWYFNTNDPLFAGLIGAHIGAKMVDLSRPGRLLSVEYTITQVPEPGTLMLLGLGFGASFVGARRRQTPGLPS